MSQILKVYTYILLDKRVGGKYMLDTIIETKKCKVCGEIKPLNQFPTHGKNKNTRRTYYKARCKVCNNTKNRERYNSDPEVRSNKSKYQQQPKYKEYRKNYRDRPDVKLRQRGYEQIKRAIRFGVPYSTEIGQQYITTLDLLGGTCCYCGVILSTDNEHADHIVPISAGGRTTPDNLICSCAKCNLSKHNKNMEEWYREQPFFSEERLQQIYAIRDHWRAIGFEVVYPTEDQVDEAHSVAEDTLDTIQNMSRLQRDPKVIQEYI